MTKASELRQLTLQALETRAKELREQISDLRYNQYQGKEKNVKKLIQLRHELARVLTVLAEHEKNNDSSVAASQKAAADKSK